MTLHRHYRSGAFKFRGAALTGRVRRFIGRPSDALVMAEGDDVAEARAQAERPILVLVTDIIEEQVGESADTVRAMVADLDLSMDDLVGDGLKEVLEGADLVDLGEWAEETIARLIGPVEDAIKAGWDMGLLSTGLDDDDVVFDLDSDEVRAVVQAINDKATTFPATVQEKVSRAVSDGILKNETNAEIIARIEKVAPDLLPWKAEQVMKTSGGGGFTGGRHLAFKEAGIGKKRWNSLLSGKLRRANHLAMHGETVGIDEVFSNGLAYPRDPNGEAGEVINCECWLEPIIDDE